MSSPVVHATSTRPVPWKLHSTCQGCSLSDVVRATDAPGRRRDNPTCNRSHHHADRPACSVDRDARMNRLGLLFLCAASCTSATAAAPPARRERAPPSVVAAFARDTAIALGLFNPALRDQLELSFEPWHGSPGTHVVRLVDPNDGRGLRLIISDDGTGPRPIATWPL